MKHVTAEWVSKAEGGYDAVCVLRRSRKANRYDAISFHRQQCAEKYLKARLQEAGIRFSKTHDLGLLLDAVRPIEPLWVPLRAALHRMTEFGVLTRYPGKLTTPAQATDAFRTCQRLRALARASLGITP